MPNLDPTVIILIVFGGVAVLMLLLMLQVQSARESRHIKKRLNRTAKKRGETVVDGGGSLRSTHGDKKYAAFDALANKFLPKPALLKERLGKTGRNVSIGQFMMYGMMAGAGLSTVLWLLLSPPSIVLLLVFVLVSMLLPHKVVTMMIAKREKRFMHTFPEALELLVRGLKSGLPIPETVRSVGEEFDGPVAVEFRGVADKVKVGVSLEDALWESVKRVDVNDYKFFVVCIAVQRETGGNLAETLTNLVDILRKRRQMKMKIKAMSSEAKASALILGSLPFIMFGLITVTNYSYASLLWLDPRGHMALAAGLGILGLGAFIMQRMVSFEI